MNPRNIISNIIMILKINSTRGHTGSLLVSETTAVRGVISTTNLAACVCVRAKCDQFLPARFYLNVQKILFA